VQRASRTHKVRMLWDLRERMLPARADTPGMTRRLCLFVCALFCLPPYAQADSRCIEAKNLRGNVKTVLISNGKVSSDTGAPRNEPHLWERWTVSRDRRTITVVQYSADDFAVLPLFNLWPTTVCEFDESGKLVTSRLKLNGLTTYTTVETTYDAQGRKRAVKSGSRNPEFTYDATYTYTGNAVTERLSRGNPTTTITERDTSGRITREIRRDVTEDLELSNVEYRYGPDTVEILGRENGKDWRIVRKLDAMGNTIESSSSGLGFESRDTFRFEYDAQGNWIRRVSTMYSSLSPPPRIGDLDVREISYWP
jgi:hypothetical protein